MFMGKENWEHFIGDISEEYRLVKEERGFLRSNIWLIFQVISSLVSILKTEMVWRWNMLGSFIKSAVRSLLKQKAYSLVNITGLALGICAVLLILMYIGYEYSYDSLHQNRDSIVRIGISSYAKGRHVSESVYITAPAGSAMKERYPEVLEYATVSSSKKKHIVNGNRGFMVKGVRYATKGFFKLFSFKTSGGNPSEDFKHPFRVILTKSMKKKLFGEERAVGKTISINGTENYLVSSIIDDPPGNSHLDFTILVSFSSLVKDKNIYIHKDPQAYMGWNGGNQYAAYLLMDKGSSVAELERKSVALMEEKVNRYRESWKHVLKLQKLSDIHLKHSSASTMRNIKVFSVIAVFILLIACINFINMSTSRAMKRAREIGVRKVMGAGRFSLIKQFLTESSILSGAGFILGLIMAYLFGGKFYSLLGREIDAGTLFQSQHILPGIGLILLTGLLSGIYPAFYLSSSGTGNLNGGFKGAASKRYFRNTLVILQFTVSIALLISTILVNKQISFMKNRDLGFDKENILYLPLESENAGKKAGIIKKNLLDLPEIVAVSGVSELPGAGFTGNGYKPEGEKNWVMINVVDVDEDFFKLFNIEVVEGRGFISSNPGDSKRYIVNESFVRYFNWSKPLGKKIERNGAHELIGVVSDFSFDRAYTRIRPLIITSAPWENRYSYLVLKTAAGINGSAFLNKIEKIWKEAAPLTPFEPGFFDDKIDKLYRSEERFQGLFFWFSCIAMGIALLGVISLASYSVEQRMKEISVRKVLGASSVSIYSMFSKEFLVLVLAGNLIAWPLVWYWGSEWLKNFAHRTDIEPVIFLMGLVISLLFSLTAVSLQILKGINSNPAEVLQWDG